MVAHWKARMIWLWALALLPATVGLWWIIATAQAQAPFSISYGETQTGEVVDRLGDEWVFSGCLSDVVTITMQSALFGSYLELYGPVGRDSLAEAGGEGPNVAATIGGYTLPESGPFTIVAAGANIRDRGAYTLSLEAQGALSAGGEQLVGLLGDGDVVTGVVETRLGDEWGIRGCLHDVIAVKMESTDFEPYVAVREPGAEESLVEMNGSDGVAIVEDLILPASGDYVVMAAGTSIRDRGAYTLTFTVIDRARPAPTATPTPTGTITPEPTATATPQPTATPASSGGGSSGGSQQPLCVVVANLLNLRPGPGTDYAPPIGALARESVVIPLNRTPNTAWIRVQVIPNGPIGWVAAAAQYIQCNINLTRLPLGVIPPTYTPSPTVDATGTPTSTSTATPTPTGTYETPTYTPTPTGTYETPTYTPTATPTVTDEYTPTYTPTPTGTYETPTYTPTPTETPTDEYTPTYTPTVTPTEGPTDTPTDTPTPTSTPTDDSSSQLPLYAAFVQTGAGHNNDQVSGALVFQVVAYDPNVGSNDGDGIDHVLMQIYEGGNKVYERQENNAHYCAFSGGEPDCEVWYFHDNDNEWPGGAHVDDGSYTLRARVRAESGDELVIDRQIMISN